MKKILLSSVVLATAVISHAAVNVDALAVGNSTTPVAQVAAKSVDANKYEAVKADATMMAADVLLSTEATGVKAAAMAESTEGKVPHYDAPDGVFYKGYYMCPARSTAGYPVWKYSELQASPKSAYTWYNSSKNVTAQDVFTWSYFDLAATNAAQAATFLTVNTVNYEASAANAYVTYDSQDKEVYNTYAPRLSVADVDSVYGTHIGVQYGFNSWIVNSAQENLFAPGFSFNIVEALATGNQSMAAQTGLGVTNETRHQAGGVPGEMLGLGMYIPAPDAQYGVNGVMFKGAIDAAATTDLTVTIYKSDDKGNVGEVIATGKVAKADLPAANQYWNYFYIPLLITDPDLGDVETTVNIDSAVIVAIDGGKNGNDGMSVTGIFQPGTYQENEYGSATPLYLYKNAEGEIDWINLGGWDFSNNTTKEKMYIYALQIGLDVENSYMNVANNDYEFKAPTAGGNKTFTIDAMYRLDAEAGVADIYGEGMDDWYTVNMTDKNVMTVTVKALPAGTAGRSSDLVVYSPGSERTFKITQGEVSGIDEIGADNADVINVEYFDLQGRKLNAQPENGIFIQKSLLSNGKTVATKVAK